MKHYRFYFGDAEMKKSWSVPLFVFLYMVLSSILATSSDAALAAASDPPPPPPPPTVTIVQIPYNKVTNVWAWKLTVGEGGIASFHVDVEKVGSGVTSLLPTAPFVFAFDNDLLGDGKGGYFWQVPGQTPNDNQYTGLSPFDFSLQSAEFTGDETFSFRYDYLWEYDDENGKTIGMRTLFNLNEQGQPVILQTLPVPEPEEYAMMIVGLSLIGAMRRRRNKTGTKGAGPESMRYQPLQPQS